MPRSRKKPYNASDTSTRKKASDTDGSPVCSTSGEIQLSRFADTNDEGKSLVHGSVSKRMGRPIEPVPQDKADSLIQWLENGDSLLKWCEQEGNPVATTVYDWIRKNPDFAQRFKQAKITGCDSIAEECQIIADDRPEDQLELNWKKLRIDTKLRLLSKWDPAKYGDKQQVEHNGGVQIILKTNVPEPDGT